MFAFFNILPIYPLDGFRVVQTFAKPGNGFVEFMRRNSYWIMLLLLIFNILDFYIGYVANGAASLVLKGFVALFGL